MISSDTSPPVHLTEEERQCAADGTLAAERRAELSAHLAVCESCATDIARLQTLMTRINESSPPAESLGDLWPGIQSRIEQGKVIGLPRGTATARPSRGARLMRHARWIVPALAAAVVLVAVVYNRTRQDEPFAITAQDGQQSIIAAADSAPEYQRQVTELLNDLELRRSLLRPETAATIDHDLRLIDQAIGELKDALARDPRNPALRQLMASYYRQKLEFLRRLGNAS